MAAKTFLATGAATAAAAVAGSVATDVDSTWYRSLDLPAWQPPGQVIGQVWTVLYALTAGRHRPGLDPGRPGPAAPPGHGSRRQPGPERSLAVGVLPRAPARAGRGSHRRPGGVHGRADQGGGPDRPEGGRSAAALRGLERVRPGAEHHDRGRQPGRPRPLNPASTQPRRILPGGACRSGGRILPGGRILLRRARSAFRPVHASAGASLPLRARSAWRTPGPPLGQAHPPRRSRAAGPGRARANRTAPAAAASTATAQAIRGGGVPSAGGLAGGRGHQDQRRDPHGRPELRRGVDDPGRAAPPSRRDVGAQARGRDRRQPDARAGHRGADRYRPCQRGQRDQRGVGHRDQGQAGRDQALGDQPRPCAADCWPVRVAGSRRPALDPAITARLNGSSVAAACNGVRCREFCR